MSLGGNPACAEAPPPRSQIRTLTMDELSLGRPLGDGASGDVFAATLVRGVPSACSSGRLQSVKGLACLQAQNT